MSIWDCTTWQLEFSLAKKFCRFNNTWRTTASQACAQINIYFMALKKTRRIQNIKWWVSSMNSHLLIYEILRQNYVNFSRLTRLLLVTLRKVVIFNFSQKKFIWLFSFMNKKIMQNWKINFQKKWNSSIFLMKFRLVDTTSCS